MDDEDEPISEKALPVSLSACADSFGGMRMLGDAPDDCVTLLQIALDPHRTMSFVIKKSDLGFKNWKKARFILEER